mmetsp:Transcript_19151/g.44818  ORF Transcript_19151/g.44818 Transcript_19151/m.44818 type:complete len:91 (-) Transcript_19151:103-375(-)
MGAKQYGALMTTLMKKLAEPKGTKRIARSHRMMSDKLHPHITPILYVVSAISRKIKFGASTLGQSLSKRMFFLAENVLKPKLLVIVLANL